VIILTNTIKTIFALTQTPLVLQIDCPGNFLKRNLMGRVLLLNFLYNQKAERHWILSLMGHCSGGKVNDHQRNLLGKDVFKQTTLS
jgi:hypothetical protein